MFRLAALALLLVARLWRNARMDLDFRKEHIGGTPGAGCSIDLRPSEGP